MSLTKIQPSGIDQTKDYSVDQLTANTVVAGGVNLHSFAISAFNRANNSLNLSAGGSITGDTTITGNLSVTGTYSQFTTTGLRTTDPIIDLSYGTTGAPSQDAGIRVLRGDENPVQLRWVEAQDHWEYTNDGASYIKIGSESDGIYANAAFAAANTVTSTIVSPLLLMGA